MPRSEGLGPQTCGLCVPQLKLEADMGHFREELMKTGKLQAREKQALAEWQAGAGGQGGCSQQPRGVGEPGLWTQSPRRACMSPRYTSQAQSRTRIRTENLRSAQASGVTDTGMRARRWWGPPR